MDHTVLKIKRIKKCIKSAGDSENNKTTMMCSYPESLLLPFLLMFLLHAQGKDLDLTYRLSYVSVFFFFFFLSFNPKCYIRFWL